MALNLLKDPVSPAPDPPAKKGKKPPATGPISGSLSEILLAIRKDKGEKVVVQGNQLPMVQRLPTGIFELDFYLGGGFPCGRYSIIYGPECLDASTFIQFEVWVDGERVNHKGGTIEKLWHRFHKKVMSGKGHYQRPKTKEAEFFAACMNDQGRIYQNRIEDVVDTGYKECLQVTTASGMQLIATPEHQFFVGSGFKPLSSLTEGDTLFAHQNVPFKGRTQIHNHRKVVHVKHHPYGHECVLEGKYVYRRLYRSRLVVEAANNELGYDEYVECLNSGKMEGFVFLSPELDVHHQDEDHTNDSLNNLLVLTANEHGRLHAIQRHNNLRYVVVEDQITSIIPVGVKHTFDIRMESPDNNYVANGVVVHNSSNKSNICLLAVAMAQRLPPPNNKAVWVDVEQSFDPVWAAKMGVDPAALYVVKPAYGEEAVDLVDGIIRASDVAIVVVDSVAALIANKEISQSTENYDIGTSALLIKRMVNKMMIAFGECAKVGHYPCVLLVNQRRFKPNVMFGDPESMPGGEAQKFLSSLRIRVSAKNVVDTATNQLAFKETNVVVKKAKVPVRAVSFKFELCVKPQDDLQIGDTDSFNMVKSHLQALGFLEKTPKGYSVGGKHHKMYFNTLALMQDAYQKDAKFQRTLQKLVIENYPDQIIVEEADYAPNDVTPGKVVQSVAPESVK